MTQCSGEVIVKKLDGGNAHDHMAYMLLYKTKALDPKYSLSK